MAAPMIQAFDQRHPVIVEPSQIRTGDWMRDLGTLRQVESIEEVDDPCAQGVCVRFVDGVNGRYATLNVRRGVAVTVWRAPLPGALHA